MNMKSQNRLIRIEQVGKVLKDNPKKDIRWIVLKCQSEFGFSERLVKEYINIIRFKG